MFIGPLPPTEAYASPWGLPAISERLRRPDGCPWDREQTHESLRSHLLEEAYEVYDALEAGATPELAGELGDLWLQIVLHAQLAAEVGIFDLADVQAAIASKIVRRHPHVFGDAEAATASDVNRQWERIKAVERAAQAEADDDRRRPSAAPSTASAARCRPWPRARRCRSGRPISATTGRLSMASSPRSRRSSASCARAIDEAERREEVGDLLMVAVNLARKHGVDAESALRAANAKFKARFDIVERLAAERGVALRDLPFDELDRLWDAAKVEIAQHRETTTQEAAR